MINNFENFSWGYNPEEDPYVKRQVFPENTKPVGYGEIMLFNQLQEALVGVVEKPDGPPVACYDSLKSLAILQDEHGLDEEDARLALNQLMDTDLGPTAPCFLDTTILEKE